MQKTTYRAALCSVHLIKYYSGDQAKRNEIGRTCGMYGDRRGAYRFLVRRPERNRQFGRPKRRQENNMKMDLQQRGMGKHGLD